MPAQSPDSVDITNVTCPFCALLCDDLTVARSAGQLRVTSTRCPIAIRGFSGVPAAVAASARIGGQPATLADATAEAARLFAAARQPLVGGLSTDLAGVRAAARLADRTGAIVDHMNSGNSTRNLLVLQDGGWITTTLSEVRNHADLLIVAGVDITRRYPRFFERTIATRETLFTGERSCDVVMLGSALPADMNLPDVAASVIPCDIARLQEGFGYLRALLAGRPLLADGAAGVTRATWEGLAGKIRGARYTVIAWAAADFDHPHAELTVQALCELVKDLNHDQRVVGLPMSGADGEVTADMVLLWQTGYSARTGFGRGIPEHDSYHNSTDRLLAQQEADLLLWVASFDATRVPPPTAAPRIVLGRADLTFAEEPAVFIPVGVPGVDHSGHLFRSDRVVTLPLTAVRPSPLPTAAQVLEAIGTALGAP
jgi:formylmethanofuran dehydrogenase subunit B